MGSCGVLTYSRLVGVCRQLQKQQSKEAVPEKAKESWTAGGGAAAGMGVANQALLGMVSAALHK
jgi:formiminotetrahydrofolate cyclodeaminase